MNFYLSSLAELISVFIALASLYFTFWIYRKQKNEARFHQEQLDALNSIASETHLITSKMEADGYRRKFVNAFFFPGAAIPNRMICLFPAKIRGRRLPTISAGDYHALHVLQSLLGGDNLDLSFQGGDGVNKLDGAERDAIYLGGPQTNPALNEFAPALEILHGRPKEVASSLVSGPLRCWFANEEIEGELQDGRARVQKKLWIRGRSDCLPSQAEHFYAEECEEPPCQKLAAHKSNLATDYAVILRLTTTRRIFVLAGIHQFGTWIAGEFLRRLSSEKDRSISPHERAAFVQQSDVMAIVWGEFDRDALMVRNLGIHQKCLWVQDGGEWKEWNLVGGQNREDVEDDIF